MKVQLSVKGLEQINAGWKRAPEMAKAELLAGMKEAVLLVQNLVVDSLPTHTGLTRDSVSADAFSVPTGVLGVVGSPLPTAAFIELGTRPHMPPVQALEQWVVDKLGVNQADAHRVAFLVARKIAKRGTPPLKVFEKALDKAAAPIGRIFEDAAARIATRLNNLNGGAA